MLRNTYELTQGNIEVQLTNEVTRNFTFVKPKEELSSNLQKFFKEKVEEKNLKVQFATVENENLQRVFSLIIEETLYVIVPLEKRIDDLAIARESIKVMMLFEKFPYLKAKMSLPAIEFINTVVIDIIADDQLKAYFESDIKEFNKIFYNTYAKLLANTPYEEIFPENNEQAKERFILDLIKIEVRNLSLRQPNAELDELIRTRFPFVHENAKRIHQLMKFTGKFEKPYNYKSLLQDIMRLELFEENIQYEWSSFEGIEVEEIE